MPRVNGNDPGKPRSSSGSHPSRARGGAKGAVMKGAAIVATALRHGVWLALPHAACAPGAPGVQRTHNILRCATIDTLEKGVLECPPRSRAVHLHMTIVGARSSAPHGT